MKYDELAFVNQQLAGLLKSGIPLEGALKQLCATMQRGRLRTEFERLEADLAQGVPLAQALEKRQLPEFYVAMLRVGIQSNDVPGVLILLADYYQKINAVWTRLTGLMVYPAIVITASLALSWSLALILSHLFSEGPGVLDEFSAMGRNISVGVFIGIWTPAIFIAGLAIALAIILVVPKVRAKLRWKLPGFREASLSQFASSLALLLGQGCHVREAIALLRQLETGQPSGAELTRWEQRLAEGKSRFSELAAGGKVFPPLFTWLVASAGEDWISGLKRAAEIYYNRAVYRIELALYAVLPVSILGLGLVIMCQVVPVVQVFIRFMGFFTSVSE